MQLIHDYVKSIRIIDGHEHLCTADMRREWDTDFFGLLHYLHSDLVTAGMDRQALDRRQHSDEERARTFLRYWERSRNTTYARMLALAVRDLYAFDDWTMAGILRLNEQVRQSSRDPDWYRHVLQESAGIDLAITLIQTTQVDFSLFRPVMFFDPLVMLRAGRDIEHLQQQSGLSLHTLADCVKAIDKLFDEYVAGGMIASKIGVAYQRSLRIENPTAGEASQALDRLLLMPTGETLPQSEAQPLQDYLIHRVIQRSADRGLPIQIHTGHHETSVTGDGNLITNSRVTNLIPVLHAYPKASFVLLHGGFPYHDEYMSIAKNFPNVYADMTWLYIISPTVSRYLLHALIEMVPIRKIIGFGGDYPHVENTYAHAELARETIAKVLADKVEEGAFSAQDACTFADRMLRDNLNELYALNLS